MNSVDIKGCTPLMIAAKSNYMDLVRYLTGAGAHVRTLSICHTPVKYVSICVYALLVTKLLLVLIYSPILDGHIGQRASESRV